MISILQYSRGGHETRRQTSLPPRGGRLAPGSGPYDDPAGAGRRDEAGDWPWLEPGVSLADRERRAPAPDAYDAGATGPVLPGVSGVPGGRSGGIYAGVAIRIEGDRREDRFVALCRRRAIHGGSGAATRTAGRCRGGGFTQGRAAAGGDSPHTRPGCPTWRSFEFWATAQRGPRRQRASAASAAAKLSCRVCVSNSSSRTGCARGVL